MRSVASKFGLTSIQLKHKYEQHRSYDRDLDETKEFRAKNLVILQTFYKKTTYPTAKQYAELEASQVGLKQSCLEAWFEKERGRKGDKKVKDKVLSDH